MRYFFFNLKLYLTRLIVCTLRENKAVFLAMYLLFAAGVVLGLFFSGFARSFLFLYEHSADYILIVFNPNLSLATLFFKRIIVSFQFMLMLMLFSLSVYLLPLKFLFMLYRGFIAGAVIAATVTLYGVIGFANSILLILPQQVIVITFLNLFSVYGIRLTLSFQRYRSFFGIRDLFSAAAVFFVLSLLGGLYEVLVIGLIIRPFNLFV